jgi:hemerythrin superfamily protein
MIKEMVNDMMGKTPDAIELLKQDHREVEALFKAFENSDDKREKKRIAKQICAELDIHAKIEEQIFYPEAETVEDAEDNIHEGFVEHEGIKRLVKEIPRMQASDDYFEPRVKVLMEYVKHHVKEEENETFPKLQKSDLDLQALGEQLAQRNERLKKAQAAASSSANARPNGSASGRKSAASEQRSAR